MFLNESEFPTILIMYSKLNSYEIDELFRCGSDDPENRKYASKISLLLLFFHASYDNLARYKFSFVQNYIFNRV